MSTQSSPGYNETTLFYFLIYFPFKAGTTLVRPWKIQISPLSSWGKRSNEAERHINGEERAKEERGEKSHSVSFEPVSPCWAEFDIQTMRQGSTQGGRLPCNINSHLESSCGYGHETLKETAAMDLVPSHHHSHCLLKRPPHCSLKPAWKSTQTGSYSLCSFPSDCRLRVT